MLSLTPAAVSLVLETARRRGVEPRLRIRVVGGGCSGLTWDWVLGEPSPQPGDLKKTTGGVTVLVDPASAAFVRGASLDAGPRSKSGLRDVLDPALGRSLVLVGVQARHPCGCGESWG